MTTGRLDSRTVFINFLLKLRSYMSAHRWGSWFCSASWINHVVWGVLLWSPLFLCPWSWIVLFPCNIDQAVALACLPVAVYWFACFLWSSLQMMVLSMTKGTSAGGVLISIFVLFFARLLNHLPGCRCVLRLRPRFLYYFCFTRSSVQCSIARPFGWQSMAWSPVPNCFRDSRHVHRYWFHNVL